MKSLIKKVVVPDEIAEEIINAIIDAGEVTIGTSATSIVTLKTQFYEATLQNMDGKSTKRKAVKFNATKGRIFKDKF